MFIAILIAVMITIVVSVSLLPAITDTVTNAVSSAEGDFSATITTNSILPTAVPIVLITVLLLGVVAWIGLWSKKEEGEEPAAPIQEAERVDWTHYGEKLKSAYTAKFTIPSASYSMEVDSKMEILRGDSSREQWMVSKGWAKRQAEFVGVPWPPKGLNDN